MYALRDLIGHCYVQFAFLFTLNVLMLVAFITEWGGGGGGGGGKLFQAVVTLSEKVLP